MALLVALVAGLVVVAESQASSETGFLSKPSLDQFISPNVNRMQTARQESLISTKEEEKAAEKGFTNSNSAPISLSAIGVGLLALATMFGVRMQRGLRPVSNPSAPLLGGNIMEMKSHGSSDKWHPMNLSSSDPTARWQPAVFAVTPGSGKLAMIEGASNPFPDGWDPAGLAELGTPATLAWFRAAELKHSRVAMAATVGWIINEAGITFDGDIATGVSFASLGKGVQAWENVPDAGKLQILLAIGAIETASEFNKPHYMKGGDLGYIKGPFGLRLWDPLGTVSGLPEDVKANKRQMELNNGRLAMIGAASMFAASYIDGSVPALPDNW
jgi:hypothetical protein